MLIDSHVNLHSERYEDDLSSVIERARAAGVAGMLTISDRLESTNEIIKIASRYDFVWRSVGVHPHHAKDHSDLTAQMLFELAADKKVIGIGESGLDFYYEHSDRDLQEPVFRAHIEAARKTGLPVIIHSRDADDVMQTVLQEEQSKGAFVPLLHCYTGGAKLAETALGMGGYISFSGVVTFKNADDVRKVVEETPLERIIIETDCPYLSPVPMRGRRNEPSFLVHVADKLAEIKGVDRELIDQVTTDNFFQLFSRAEHIEEQK